MHKIFLIVLPYYAKGVMRKIDEHHVFLLSGGLTFSLLVCMLPLLLMIFSFLCLIMQASFVRDYVTIFIDNFFPYQEYASSIKEIIFSRVDEFFTVRKFAGFWGGVGLIFAASGLFGSIRVILNRIFEVQVSKHALLTKLRDFAMVFLVLFLFLASTILLPALQIVSKAKILQPIKNYLHSTEHQLNLSLTAILLSVLSLIAVSGILFLIYSLVPDKRPDYKTALVCSVSASLLWELARQGFGYYIVHIVSWKELYGAYVLFVVFAFWIYYSSLVFIISAEIGQLYRERRDS